MALSKSHRIIWLDTFIGQDEEYQAFKRRFAAPIEPLARVGDEIDRLIQTVQENAAPFIFAEKIGQAMDAICNTNLFRVIFISSGSLGRLIIPKIHPQHRHVYSLYIFCGKMANYTDLIIDYADVIQIFDHEVELLVRLVRDLSLEIIKRGEALLNENKPAEAKDLFERARNMELAANNEDKLHPPFLERLVRIGDENNPGLLQTAEVMMTTENGQQTQTAQPVIARESEGEEHGNTNVNAGYAVGVQAEGNEQTYMDEPQDSPVGQEAS